MVNAVQRVTAKSPHYTELNILTTRQTHGILTVDTGPLPKLGELLGSPTSWFLIIANTLPLFGVLYFHWAIADLILLYWSENIVIGLYTLLKILIVGRLRALPNAVFFTLHYGIFTAAHGVFVFQLFNIPVPVDLFTYQTANLSEYGQHVLTGLLQIFPAGLYLSLLALLISHGISFLWNFMRKGEYRQTTVKKVLFSPYGRVVILHITILLGGMIIKALDAPLIALLILVSLKTAMDVVLHWRSHRAMVTI